MSYEVKIPDIGDFTDVPIVTILVESGRCRVGRRPASGDSKATRQLWKYPARSAGKVIELKVAEGDTVSEGSLVLLVEAEGGAPASEARS